MVEKTQPQLEEAVALGEVISSSITSLVGQCWQGTDADGLPHAHKPNFGSFLRIDCNESPFDLFAIVYNVITGPTDNIHKPSALGMSRNQLKAEQPHIFALLRTEVHALTIGYSENGRVFQHLPPQPPEVHDFIYCASESEVESFTQEFDFLRLVSGVSEVPADELLAATIREAYRCHGNDYDFLVAAGQSISHLLRSDYDRLVSVLRKIRPDSLV